MNIELEDIVVKNGDEEIFNKLTLVIPTNKIIGICGNLHNNFIDLLITKRKDDGIINDNGYLDDSYLLEDYINFMTSNLEDEIYLLSCKYDINRDYFIEMLNDFSLNESYLSKDLSLLSSCEKKIIKFIIAFLTSNKVIIIKDIFNNLDYYHKRLLVTKISKYRKRFNKVVFIDDANIDLLYSLVDKFIVVDTSLITIHNFEKIMIMDGFRETSISVPNIINFTNLLKEKGFDVKYHKSISKLVEDVRNCVS